MTDSELLKLIEERMKEVKRCAEYDRIHGPAEDARFRGRIEGKQWTADYVVGIIWRRGEPK